VSGPWAARPIAIIGGGQLGRLLAISARTLGFGVRVLDPDPFCPARRVVDELVTARLDDVDAIAELARGAAVVTFEIEAAGVHALEAAALHAPVRPRPAALAIIQDRAVQKAWLVQHGYPVGPYRAVTDTPALDVALEELGSSFVKCGRGGYDGRGQVRVRGFEDFPSARALLASGGGAVVEQALDLEAEISVLVARSARGEIAVYPPALNHHEGGVLAWSLLPASLPASRLAEACDIARAIAVDLDIEGLLTVELFVLPGGRLLVNELAPRPHNTFHTTEIGCVTSQFEQGIRAILGLPLGSVELVRPAAIGNLLGDRWAGGAPPPFARALAISGVRLHLYEKREARPGRKMGHLLASGATPDEALARMEAALRSLDPGEE
jgi:5-(carboxyamino)imidazole ribonucleotide synthase